MSGRTTRSVRSRHSVHNLYDDLPVSEPTELDFSFSGAAEPEDELIKRAISQIGDGSVLN